MATYNGTTNNDVITGSTSDDIINGLNGDDTLNGGSGNDTIDGGAGKDFINGGAGDDTLIGGYGGDTYIVNTENDVIQENDGEGFDHVLSYNSYTSSSFIERLDLVGSVNSNGTGNNQNNYLLGNSGNNILSGLDGNDIILGAAGNDTLIGGSGNDYLDGGSGEDAMTGGTGDDKYVVNNTNDTVTELANEGFDTVLTTVDYTIDTSIERVELIANTGLTITGNNENNIVVSKTVNSNDVIDGGAGNDILNGGFGNDTLTGGAGDDLLINGETMTGGIGNDTYVITGGSGHVLTENANEGTDTVKSTITHTLGDNFENLELVGTTTANGTGNNLANRITGNNYANTLIGLDGNDILVGGGSNDTLIGGNGADLLNGGIGTDTLIGGLDNDTYVVDLMSDSITENANEGYDTIQSYAVTYTMGDNTERMDLMGTNNIDGTGNASNNLIFGNSGNNTIDGGAGNDSLYGKDGDDILTGGLGNDVLIGGAGNDTYLESITNFGTTIISDTSGNDKLDLSAYDWNDASITALNEIGSNGKDHLLLDFGNGNSFKIYNYFDDTEDYNAGSGNIELFQFSDGLKNINDVFQALGINPIQNTIIGTNNDDTLYGTSLNDAIYGRGGEDRLYGGAGNDVLYGEEGRTYFYGGDGHDTYYLGTEYNYILFENDWGNDHISVEGFPNYFLRLSFDTNESIYIDMNNGTMTSGNNSLTWDANIRFGDINSGDGDDTIYVTGDTEADGKDGNDIIYAGDGDNWLRGRNGDDILYGGGGDDWMFAYSGNDQLYGGTGNDRYRFDSYEGTEYISDESGTADILDFWGHYSSAVTASDWQAVDSDGNGIVDQLHLKDWVIVENYFDNSNAYAAGSGNLEFTEFRDITYDFNDVLGFLNVTPPEDPPEDPEEDPPVDPPEPPGPIENTITGTNNDDTIYGTSQNDLIYGRDGEDRLFGEAGDDVLYGEEGDTYFYGGEGQDTYYLGTDYNYILLEDNWGHDHISVEGFPNYFLRLGFDTTESINIDMNSGTMTSGNNSLTWDSDIRFHSINAGNGDDLITGDSHSTDINGYDGNDTIYAGDSGGWFRGWKGDDVIYGGDGDDRMWGEQGNDELYGGAGNDRYLIDAAQGNLIIDDSSGSHDRTEDWFSNSDLSELTVIEAQDSNGDGFVDQLYFELTRVNSAQDLHATITIKNYFDNTSADHNLSGEGVGLIEDIYFQEGIYHFDDMVALIDAV